MNLPQSTKELLALETDLPLTPEDLQAMSRPHPEATHDLAFYLSFLEEIGAFATRKTIVKLYSEEFTLSESVPKS